MYLIHVFDMFLVPGVARCCWRKTGLLTLCIVQFGRWGVTHIKVLNVSPTHPFPCFEIRLAAIIIGWLRLDVGHNHWPRLESSKHPLTLLEFPAGPYVPDREPRANPHQFSSAVQGPGMPSTAWITNRLGPSFEARRAPKRRRKITRGRVLSCAPFSGCTDKLKGNPHFRGSP